LPVTAHTVVQRNASHRLARGPPQTSRAAPVCILIGRMGIPYRGIRLLSVAHAPDPASRELSDPPSTSHPGVVMRRAGPSQLSEVARHAGVPPISPSWPRAFRPAWRAFMGWSAHPPVGHGLAGSSGRQPEPETEIREMSTAAGRGGGAALDRGTSGAPPPIPPVPCQNSSPWG
jgi:hypothetical protein